MKKQALALAVALTLSVSVFASSAIAKEQYTVQTGDTLWDISRSYNLSLAELKQLNELDSNDIYPDQALTVEEMDESVSDDGLHSIVYGDTLFDIANEYDVSVADLQAWNNLSSDLIYAGETLAVEASAAKKSSTSKRPVSVVKSTKPTSAPVNAIGKTYTMRATAYTAYCTGCSGVTANGTDLRANPNQKVIAVDPRVIPLGTKVWVEGYGEAIAADTGGAIKGNKIDVFIPSDGQARQWGVKTVTLKILE